MFKPYHKILGIKISQNLYFNTHVDEISQKLRKYLKWIKRYKSQLTERQKRTSFCMFIQSQMDYHLLPIWYLISKEARKKFTRISTQGARIVLGTPTTIDGDICCREARLLPPEFRVELMYLRRQEKLKCLPNLALKSYINQRNLLVFQEKNQEEFLKMSDEELWKRYHFRNPERASTLQVGPPKKLSYTSRISFLLRTEQIKTKDWRVRHHQPYPDQQPQDGLCRYCSQEKEEIHHLLDECSHPTPSQARRPLLALHQSMEANQPTVWSAGWILTRRGDRTENEKIEQALSLWAGSVLPTRLRCLSPPSEEAPREPPCINHCLPPAVHWGQWSPQPAMGVPEAVQPPPLPALGFRSGGDISSGQVTHRAYLGEGGRADPNWAGENGDGRPPPPHSDRE